MFDRVAFNRNTIIKIILGTLVGILAVYFAFRDVSISGLLIVLRQASPWLVAAGVGVVLLNVAVLALRWWVMQLRTWRTSEYASLLGGVYLGQMFNILLPVRLGELARIYFVGEKTEITKSQLFGSLVLEKGIDLITFGGALFLLIMALSLPTWMADPVQSLLWLALISALGVIVLSLWGRGILGWLTPLIKKLPAGWGDRIAGILERALTGFDSMHSWKQQFPIWLLSSLSLFLSTLTNFAILRALSIPVPYMAALFVLIVLQVGSAPPSAPGKLGVFHYLGVLALSVFEVEKGLALAYSVLLYMVALLPKVLIGAGVMVFSRWKLPDIGLKIEDY